MIVLSIPAWPNFSRSAEECVLLLHTRYQGSKSSKTLDAVHTLADNWAAVGENNVSY